MNSKYILNTLIAVFVLSSCHFNQDGVLSHGGEHHEEHDKSHSEDHNGGHHVGVLEITNPIIKDTILHDEFVCQITAHQHIELKTLEEGYLDKILVDEGQLVKKGQLLFEIQPTIYQAEIQKAKAEVLKAEAEKEKTVIEVQNLKALVDSNIISRNELMLAEAEMHRAEAQVDNSIAELNLMEAHMQFTKIRAPFDGIIGRFEDIRQGALLEEGEKLTTLTDNSEMWVYFNVPESKYLEYYQEPSESSELDLQLANNQIFEHKGVITAIEAVFDNTTGTVPFRATFDNPSRLLRHGQTGNILWPTNLNDVLMIPQKATYEVLEKRYVFIVDGEGIVSSREIKVTAELDHLYVVSDGLTINDKILIEGLRQVKNGDQVEYEYKEPSAVYNNLNLHAE